MTHYRLYQLSAASGRIHSARDIEAASDEDAIGMARPLLDDQAIEIWCGARKVHRLEAPAAVSLGRRRVHNAEGQFESSAT